MTYSIDPGVSTDIAQNSAPPYPTLAQLGTPRSGLLQLRNSVAAYFESYGVGATVTPVGLKYREFRLNQSDPSNANRVVFIPGEYDGNGAPKSRGYGELSRNSRNHSSVVNPRELLGWGRPFTISCWSAPKPGQSKDEGETINLAEDLLEQVIRAVHARGQADIIWGGVTITSPPQENMFGVELLVHAIQNAPFFDVTADIAQPIASVNASNVWEP